MSTRFPAGLLAAFLLACGTPTNPEPYVPNLDVVFPDTGRDVAGLHRDLGGSDPAADDPGDADAGPSDPGPADPGTVPGCGTLGQPCNDGDDCTNNDQCTAAGCRGTPVSCPDDGLPCTDASCVTGTCRQVPRAGTCLIAGACWSDGQAEVGNPCRRCDATLRPADWSPVEGTPCDDGNACTAPDTCHGGTCAPGADTCGPPLCTLQQDCFPTGWCGLWFLENRQRCSRPCQGTADCEAGQACTPVPGSAGQGYCQPEPNPSGQGPGGSCSTGWDCRSGLCVDSTCREFCASQAACTGGTTCSAVGDPAAGFNGACLPHAALGGLSLGAACTQDGTVFDANLCDSGHCDLIPEQAPWRCAPLCATDAQCGPTQECNIVLASTQAIADSIHYATAYDVPTRDATMGCYTRLAQGTVPVGSPCTLPSDCRTFKCMALLPGSNDKVCTTYCVSDADCPATLKCAPEVITLSSAWLVVQGGQSSDRTLVRMCRPK